MALITDLVSSNNIYAELRDAMEAPDARAAVGALKAILGETAKQNDIANILLTSIQHFCFVLCFFY